MIDVLPIAFIFSSYKLLVLRNCHASHLWRYLPFYWRFCFWQFLYAIQKSKRMALGELLDCWWFVFMACCTAHCCMAYDSKFFRDCCQRSHLYIALYFPVWFVMGDRRMYLWTWCSLSWCCVGKQHHFGFVHGLWFFNSLCLLSIIS